jgi:hypothetical protein
MGKDILVGKQTIVGEPQHGSSSSSNSDLSRLSILHVELDIVFSSTDGDTTLPTKSATLTVMVTVSANVTDLHYAKEAMTTINTIKTWKSAVNIIKQVMDTVSSIAGVCSISFCSFFAKLTSALQLNPYASLAWSLLSRIPEECLLFLSGIPSSYSFILLPRCQTLLQQVQRDKNVEALLNTI